MGANQKPRKKYKPKTIYTNVLHSVFGGMTASHGEHTVTLMTKTYAALRALEGGAGGRKDFDLVIGALNVANVMREQGYAPEYEAELLAARDAMLAMGMRGAKASVFTFEGDELAIVSEALAVHDAQIENARSIDIDRASDEVVRRVKNRINTKSVLRELAKGA